MQEKWWVISKPASQEAGVKIWTGANEEIDRSFPDTSFHVRWLFTNQLAATDYSTTPIIWPVGFVFFNSTGFGICVIIFYGVGDHKALSE